MSQDLLFVSMEDWDDIWRRNQFLCAGFARRFPDRKILFVGLPRNASHALRHGQLRALKRQSTYPVPDLPSITVTHPLKLWPNTLTLGRRLNEAQMRRHILRIATEIGLHSPTLWLNPHYAVHLAGHMGERAVIYDITDDWISLTQSERLRALTAAQDAELCRRADAVIVCSERLQEMKRNLARRLFLIPNGVDAAHYRCVLDAPPATPRWSRPVLGYTGSIHPDRVDIDLIEAVAKRLSEGTIVLVGPNMLREPDESRLQRCGNVVLTGPVPYARVPEMMREFDVSITPHRVTPFTESLNPIKLWEYLAAGKPIVSTPVAGFRDYPNLVRTASGAEEFLAQVRVALVEAPDLAQARRQEAQRHSWTSRLDAVIDVLNTVTPHL
jgi:glycosyltransferase involved in cell wall biosynthesis